MSETTAFALYWGLQFVASILIGLGTGEIGRLIADDLFPEERWSARAFTLAFVSVVIYLRWITLTQV